MGFQTNGPIADLVKDGKVDAKPEKVHVVQVGPQQALRIPHSEMKRCPCGCDRFTQQFNIGFIKPPQLGAEPLQITAQLFLCAECGLELRGDHPQVKDKKIQEGA